MPTRTAPPAPAPPDVRAQQHHNAAVETVLYLVLLAGALVIGGLTVTMSPRPWPLAATILVLALVTIALKPVVGIYLLAFFTLLSDASTAPWYPFTKNFSSRESVLFVADQLTITPLEVCLGATLVGWLLNMAASRRWVLHRGTLFWPMTVFSATVLVGLVYGVVTGGDRYVAVWEIRPLLYLPLYYLVITNLLRTARQYHVLVWVSMIAILGQSLIAIQFYSTLSPAEREFDSFTDHPTVIPMNALFVLALTVWLLRTKAWGARLALLAMAPPVLYVYMLSQRRAGVIGLVAGVLVLGVVLFWRRRRAFWIAAPLALVLAAGYTAAFWNTTSGAGIGAQAVKSVIAPGDLSDEDQSSDIYRYIENYNLTETIRSSPLTGIGFGQRFHQPIALPDISFFVFYEYMPHNSVLWIWLKTGVVGFVSMLYLMMTTIRRGVSASLRVVDPLSAAFVIAATAYVVSYMVFAYVDIAWDARSMVFLAITIAVAAEFPSLLAQRQPHGAVNRRIAARR